MKHRVGLLLILTGFLELAWIFWQVGKTRQTGDELPLTGIVDADVLTSMAAVIFVFSPFLFIIIGVFCLETGCGKLQTRKRQGLCWKCGHSLKDAGPEYACPCCGHEHKSETIRLYLEIADKQHRLRELGNE